MTTFESICKRMVSHCATASIMSWAFWLWSKRCACMAAKRSTSWVDTRCAELTGRSAGGASKKAPPIKALAALAAIYIWKRPLLEPPLLGLLSQAQGSARGVISKARRLVPV